MANAPIRNALAGYEPGEIRQMLASTVRFLPGGRMPNAPRNSICEEPARRVNFAGARLSCGPRILRCNGILPDAYLPQVDRLKSDLECRRPALQAKICLLRCDKQRIGSHRMHIMATLAPLFQVRVREAHCLRLGAGARIRINVPIEVKAVF